MGAISLEQLLPEHITRPDDASPISAAGFPDKGWVTRIGFDHKTGDTICFEGETPVYIRFCQRLWKYRLREDQEQEAEKQQAGKAVNRGRKFYETNRWRLEIAVDTEEAGPIQPAHLAVVAQVPYASEWVQTSALKKYSKKPKKEEAESGIPVLESAKDVEEKLETANPFDLWETNRRYVAGISFPNGYRGIINSHPRNTAIDFVLGVCPDFMALRNELLASPEIQNLLKRTQQDQITFWNRAKVHGRPRLYGNTQDAAEALMLLSIEQSLAGPQKNVKTWIGKPVWKLVGYRYRDHLNNANRIEHRRREDQLSEEHERLL